MTIKDFVQRAIFRALPLTSVRPTGYTPCEKQESKAFNLASIFFQFLVPNQCGALYGIRNLLRYGISPWRVWNQCQLHCMESTAGGMESFQRNVWNQERRGTGEYSLTADAMRGRAAIPCNSLCELMPCQALRSWIKNNGFKRSRYFLVEQAFRKSNHFLPIRTRRYFGNNRSCQL